MTTFICKHCSYRFEREKELDTCPYCGEDGSVIKEQTADELLKNLED